LVTEQDDIMEEHMEELEEESEETTCDCAEELEQLEREKAQLGQQLLRLKADFDNYRRRTQTQMEEVTKNANEHLLKDLLPVLDNFERALATEHADQEHDGFFQGMEMVYQGLMAALAQHGLDGSQLRASRSIRICMKQWPWRQVKGTTVSLCSKRFRPVTYSMKST